MPEQELEKQAQSPCRHCGYRERSHGTRGYSRRYDDRDYHGSRGHSGRYDARDYHESRGRRYKTESPRHGKGRNRSPGGRRRRSSSRDGSEERRAKIEQWNRGREEAEYVEIVIITMASSKYGYYGSKPKHFGSTQLPMDTYSGARVWGSSF